MKVLLPILVLLAIKIANAAIVYDAVGTLSVNPKLTNCLPSDDYAADIYENNKFYRCANGYQYSFRCPPGTIYFGNGLCNYGTPSTINGGTTKATLTTSSNCATGCPYTFNDPSQQTQFCVYNNFAVTFPCCCNGQISPCISTPCQFKFQDATQQSNFCADGTFSTNYPCCCNAAAKKRLG